MDKESRRFAFWGTVCITALFGIVYVIICAAAT